MNSLEIAVPAGVASAGVTLLLRVFHPSTPIFTVTASAITATVVYRTLQAASLVTARGGRTDRSWLDTWIRTVTADRLPQVEAIVLTRHPWHGRGGPP